MKGHKNPYAMKGDSMDDIFAVGKNRKYLQELADNKKIPVPFIGAGFSKPYCAGWEDFLKNYFAALKRDGALLQEEITEFERLKDDANMPNRLEQMANFLVKASPGPGFKEQMKLHMDVTAPPDKVKKYHLLHAAFPFLKITTNFDRLIETTVPHGVHVHVASGNEKDKLERLFTQRHELDSLLKIHGSVTDMTSIVLSADQYRELYGHEHRYDSQAGLPSFLRRVFTNATVLFIGCSLEQDRVTMIMEDLAGKDQMPNHFAIKKLPDNDKEKIHEQRRLAELGICTIWIKSYEQIQEILAFLAGKPLEPPVEVSRRRLGSFVGREKELAAMAANLDAAARGGGVQAITGRLYSIDGIGGVGKTALALEAAQRFRDKFKDGVLPLFRADEHTPMSFARALAERLEVKLTEPADAEAALQAVAYLLRDRNCLILLDNVEKWEDLRYMIPQQTSAAFLVTTRNRDIYRKLWNFCRGLQVEEIPLDKFTEEEALALFCRMMGREYREEDRGIYLEIARDLGYLPIALRQAISLMVYTPHYRVRELRDKLKSDERLELLRRGCAEVESDTRVIEAVFDLSAQVLTKELREVLALLAVCGPGPVPLDFLKRFELSKVLGGVGTSPSVRAFFKKGPDLPEAKEPGLAEIFERLYTYSWCERREMEGERYYELHQLVRDLVRLQGKRETEGKLPYLEQFIDVVHEIFTDKDVHYSVKERYYFQLEEAFSAAVERKDTRLKQWLYDLVKFCTYRGYGHFYIRLTEAVERLFPGDQWDLGAVYSHRALILQGWGKLEEAMTLSNKVEAICDELGDRAGLSACYGNQAVILKAWGRLEEAMALHQKEEKIKEQLGDRAGLAICWWNQGLIYKKQGDPHAQAQLWRKAIETKKSMGIPTDDDEKELKDLNDKMMNDE
ncbi:MAG: SIR2 family protein [Candidatus Aminicenantes bacterium]|nr:SIR2 family protein [Candidatus Aminicenantes bacterium]